MHSLMIELDQINISFPGALQRLITLSRHCECTMKITHPQTASFTHL